MAARRRKNDSSTERPPDQRTGQRYTLLLRAAKLVTGQGEYLCLVRDVSDRGLKVRLFHDLAIESQCEIELGSGERLSLECVWQRDLQAGFRFAGGPRDVQKLIDEAGPFPKRHLRLRLNPPLVLMLVSGGLATPGRLCDISQHGAAIALDRSLPLGAQARIEAPALPLLHARVRWRRGGLHGLVFQEGFRLDELAQLTRQLQQPSAEPAKMPDSRRALTID
ncbi:PilZ domain-containing protein [Novosphingobium sp.]|uniref:PilZ domain-containing protein n=1 Tax=Novosphingobium sp. TaxID=1874826 RepID=UPI0025FD976E|nr:PilZ domain-containing protein [Novosphingobium sp.]MCC6926679.1 PilZ domain-containing protein [Novosphingobium sp.]